MRPMQKASAALVLGMVLASLSLVPAGAGESPRLENAVARVNVGPAGVDWSPTVDYERLVLTVVGPEGFENRQELKAGESPTLSLFKPNGERLPDGIYRYELRILPKAAGQMDKTLQSGAVWIRDGAFITPTSEKNLLSSAASGKPPHNITGKDSVVADDLVVQGTACIGPGCLNGDPDATNTVKLKSRFPRILFDDPNGIGCCFPATDWILQANSTDLPDFFLQEAFSGFIPFEVFQGAPSYTLVLTHGDGFSSTSGRVGINTRVPLKPLHVLSDTGPTIRLEQPVSPGPARTWDVGANDTQFFISDITAGTQPFRIRAGAPTSSIDVAASGNVGVGTASPSVRLEVKSSSNGASVQRLQSSSATGYSGTEYLNNAGTVSLYIGTDNGSSNTRFNSINNYPIVILTESAERMRITSAGSIGIGTSSPSSKLHVNGGDIRVSGGSFIDDGVTLNAPDYVFEPDYSLMPIEDLRTFVNREKRLPNVPSARDIKSQGLNLSQFQMRLLEKVEELTLYTLSQQEQITQLTERLAALEKPQPAPSPVP